MKYSLQALSACQRVALVAVLSPVWAVLQPVAATEMWAAEPAKEVATFGSWSVLCEDSLSRSCHLSQAVAADPQGQKTVLGILVDIVDRTPRITFRMTSDAYVPAGAGVKIDDHEDYRVPLSNCDSNVCEVRAWLDQDILAQMQAGTLLRFAFFLDKKRQVTYPVSLAGFENALECLRARLVDSDTQSLTTEHAQQCTQEAGMPTR